MHEILWPIHITFAGLWLGCVLTEALFERALLGKGRPQALILVDLHKRVDQVVEIPAFLVVLITGALMYTTAELSALLQAKVGFGLLAVAANAYCVALVFQRATAAHQERWDDFARLDHKQHLYGAVVLVGILVALVLGVTLHARGA